ncbi:MAG: 16S rRNA (adenine(1518)-N(6)/adenine(1519)-N(6))-dimethyltransferase RsmA [Porticoccaceae bacterium]|jgi:16S rRNA (adenine1518-N6/adenine1519-N6)-dimethyltransferase|nr:16S rRNA (adenine(1518)-N(6)/adenine(1519)-N(6))-dimethyltransferase RsmA [Porticoccaceae bacterium]MDG1307555.1 16S rRNA (adenine(1518)-N(6)/adenine(1519)-N(6))-dimethyltransferase RsmA [Porticoccaceae bacterium]
MTIKHQARKRFGQNFLVDQQIISQIVSAVNPQPDENLIEIGPGMAAITEHLVKLCPTMSVLELDRDLVEFLGEKFADCPDFTIHSGDALKTDFGEFYQGRELRLVGNLPYNISTPLLFHLLNVRHLIKDMHFMLQREVVDRLGATPGTKAYGRLSVMIQYHCRVMPLIPVPPESFRPAPKVQSAVVRLKPHKTMPCTAFDEQLLSKIVAQSFQMRRKTLRNCLKPYAEHLGAATDIIDLGRRPEQLSVTDFVTLSNLIHNSIKSNETVIR